MKFNVQKVFHQRNYWIIYDGKWLTLTHTVSVSLTEMSASWFICICIYIYLVIPEKTNLGSSISQTVEMLFSFNWHGEILEVLSMAGSLSLVYLFPFASYWSVMFSSVLVCYKLDRPVTSMLRGCFDFLERFFIYFGQSREVNNASQRATCTVFYH